MEYERAAAGDFYFQKIVRGDVHIGARHLQSGLTDVVQDYHMVACSTLVFK